MIRRFPGPRRLLTVFLSVATITSFISSAKNVQRAVGLLAALFLYFSPEHNRISHYMNPDSPMVFFCPLISFIWRIYKPARENTMPWRGSSRPRFAIRVRATCLHPLLAHLFYVREPPAETDNPPPRSSAPRSVS